MAEQQSQGARPRLSGPAVEERLALLDRLLGQLEQGSGPVSEMALEAVATLTAIYGEALARITDALPEATAGLATDELTGHLLILHGLSPVPAADRIMAALKNVRPQAGDVQLVGLEDGVARVQLAARGCSSSAGAMRAAITDVVLAAAPELASVEVEPAAVAAEPALIPVEAVLRPPVEAVLRPREVPA
ncbi:MAG TPA: NifU family protein [Trebonia sp.]|nr:NifU family protein [Trebonia sp.]